MSDFDYEDLAGMQLSDAELAEVVGQGGECIFNWTTKEGHPVGVVVAYIYKDGTFWTTCAERRKRVPALRKRPQSGIVINKDGRTASYKGDSKVHQNGDPGFNELKTWFYGALSGAAANPQDQYRQAFAKFLDSPHRVIIETPVKLIVGFDVMKFREQTNRAIAAGLAD